MPPHDPNDRSATGRPPFGGDSESIDDEDFWDRARRTKKEDKKASKRKGDGGRKATSARKRKTPDQTESVSFALPPTGGAKGGTDYPVSPRKARARRLLQGLPPDEGPPGPGGPPPGPPGAGVGGPPPAPRGRPNQGPPPAPGPGPGPTIPPDPQRQAFAMGPPTGQTPRVPPSPPPTQQVPRTPPGPSRMPSPNGPANGPGRMPPGQAMPPAARRSPTPPAAPPTAPTPQVPSPPGTPPLMSPMLARRRAQRAAGEGPFTGQVPAASPTTPPSPGAPRRTPPGGSGGAQLRTPPSSSWEGSPLSGEVPVVPGPSTGATPPTRGGGRPRLPLSGEVPVVPGPTVPAPPSSRGRPRLPLSGEVPAVPDRSTGATPPTRGGRSRLPLSGETPAVPPHGGRPPGAGSPPRTGRTDALGTMAAGATSPSPPRSRRPDPLGSPTAGTGAPTSTGRTPSTRLRRSNQASPPTGTPSPRAGRSGPAGQAAPPISPPGGTPATWDSPGSTGGSSLGRANRTGQGRTPSSGRPGSRNYPASGRTANDGPLMNPTGPAGTVGNSGNVSLPTQPTPAVPPPTGRGNLRRPSTGSTPIVPGPDRGPVGPISAELPVVEPGPVAGVTASPWEAPPSPRNAGGRPTEPRTHPRPRAADRGDATLHETRIDNLMAMGGSPLDEPEATERVSIDPVRDLQDAPSLRGRPDRPERSGNGSASALSGPAATGPGTMTRRPASDEFDSYDVDDDNYGDDIYNDDFDGSERQGCGRLAVPLVVVAAALCIILLIVAFWARRQINPGGPPGTTVTIEVVSGQSTSDIGQVLEDDGIITHAGVWTWYVRLRGGGDVQAGTYEMHKNMSMGDALDTLTSGPLPPDARQVTVVEGLTIKEMVTRLTSGEGAVDGFTAEGMNAALADPAMRSSYLPTDQQSLEGTLFPETYNLAEDATEADLVSKMVSEFDTTLDELGMNQGAESLGYSPYEVLVVASLIEEEAKVDEDRAKIARVIYNRLDEDMALGIDATSCYLKEEPGCTLTAADLDIDSPYNTRRSKGLPPTPIAAPSRKSIEAALHPAQGDWLYYVLKDADGRHVFVTTNEDFLEAKQACADAGLGCG